MKPPKKAAGRISPNPERKILAKIQHFVAANQRCLFILKGNPEKIVLPASAIKIQFSIKGKDTCGREIIIPIEQIEAVIVAPVQRQPDDFEKIRNDLAHRLLSDENFFVTLSDGRRIECTPEFLAFFYRKSDTAMVGLREKNGASHEIPIQDILCVAVQSS